MFCNRTKLTRAPKIEFRSGFWQGFYSLNEMIAYKNLSNRSGVETYFIGEDYISIRFTGSDRIYTYSYRLAGIRHVEQMKLLAEKGAGLGTYISKNVKDLFE